MSLFEWISQIERKAPVVSYQIDFWLKKLRDFRKLDTTVLERLLLTIEICTKKSRTSATFLWWVASILKVNTLQKF